VIVLDENVFESQWTQLRRWRIHLYQIGRDAGRKGMADEEIITLLRRLHRPSFVSRDRDFFDKTLGGGSFCLLYLDIRPFQVAEYVRRLLRHPEFNTWSQRKGRVVRVRASGISAWHVRAPRVVHHPWAG
jgi:hypothetical protein